MVAAAEEVLDRVDEEGAGGDGEREREREKFIDNHEKRVKCRVLHNHFIPEKIIKTKYEVKDSVFPPPFFLLHKLHNPITPPLPSLRPPQTLRPEPLGSVE